MSQSHHENDSGYSLHLLVLARFGNVVAVHQAATYASTCCAPRSVSSPLLIVKPGRSATVGVDRLRRRARLHGLRRRPRPQPLRGVVR